MQYRRPAAHLAQAVSINLPRFRVLAMASKRQRVDSELLATVVHTRGVSGSALRKVLNAVTEAGLTRREVEVASYARFNQVKHTLRFPSVAGGEVSFDVCDPKALLALLLSENPVMRQWFEEAWRTSSSTPSTAWNLLIGWDEFTPGNKAALKNSRKMMTLSFSFVELRAWLHHDHAWVTPLAIRSTVLAQVQGGWSAILRAFLRLMLIGAEGMQTSGYPVPVGRSSRLLFAKVHTLLSDGDGLRQGLEWKGAGGLKCCFRHWNVFSRGSGRAAAGPGELYVETTCSDPTKFRTWTSADLQTAAGVLIEARRRHAAREIPKARVDTIEQAYGFKFSEQGLVADARLAGIIDWPVACKYDWVHTLLSGGAPLMVVLWRLISACEEFGLPGQAELHGFLQQGWCIPKASQHGSRDIGKLHKFFDESSRPVNREQESVRCGASELLALARVFSHFVDVMIPADPRIDAHKQCFLAHMETTDILLSVKTGRRTCAAAAELLARCVQRQMEQFILANGGERVTPKMHWCFDLAEQLRDSDFMMDAFVIERLHLRARAVADHVQNTSVMESSVCAGLVNVQANAATTMGGLEGAVAPYPHPQLQHVSVSDRMRAYGKRFCTGDLVESSGQVACIVACTREHAELKLIVDVCCASRAVSRHGRICTRMPAQRCVWSAAEASPVAAWQHVEGDGDVLVLLQ